MKFSTKAKNLFELSKLNLKNSIIPKFYKYSVKTLINNEGKIIEFLNKKLNKKICLRSSFFYEDGKKNSMAGEFEGYSNINNNKKEIKIGIRKLIKQYKQKTKLKNIFNNSEIIFQNYISESVLSGVITNKCIKDGSDYYVINYDDTSNSTDTVTSGSKSGGRVLNVFKHKTNHLRSKKFKKIITAVKEIEKRVGNHPLDIEFALNKKNEFFLFQIRLITTVFQWKKIDHKFLELNIKKNQKKFEKELNKNKDISTLASFGLMPDWNPVEMIGYQPDKLSFSLYKKLITDSAWNVARSKMEYNQIDRNLMTSFSGKPYIDTRLSFFSLIPAKLNKNISKKIVNHWLLKLNRNPFLHDKIEFDIADSCFDLNSKKKIFSEYKFLDIQQKKKYFLILKDHTERLINNFSKDLNNDKKTLFELEKYREIEISNFIKKKENPISVAEKLLRKLKFFGIIPFSKFARHAFIGKKFINSLLNRRLINFNEYSKLLSSTETVSSDYRKIKKGIGRNKDKLRKFQNYFYHLRPGTYDVKTKRSIPGLKKWKLDNFNKFFVLNDNFKKVISKKKLKLIDNYFKKNNINIKADTLLSYSLTSIKLRENSKFLFTRALSDTLELIKTWAKTNKINLNIISSMNFNQILKISKKSIDINYLNKMSKKEQINRTYDHYIKLPFLITTPKDFYVASILLTKPNFVTKKIVSGNIHIINNPNKEIEIKDKIVMIENADPGYDWVLSKKIKGLITKYGGVNSHMSIRCEELNMPAAIGVGDKNYDELSNHSKIILDCKENKLNISN